MDQRGRTGDPRVRGGGALTSGHRARAGGGAAGGAASGGRGSRQRARPSNELKDRLDPSIVRVSEQPLRHDRGGSRRRLCVLGGGFFSPAHGAHRSASACRIGLRLAAIPYVEKRAAGISPTRSPTAVGKKREDECRRRMMAGTEEKKSKGTSKGGKRTNDLTGSEESR